MKNTAKLDIPGLTTLSADEASQLNGGFNWSGLGMCAATDGVAWGLGGALVGAYNGGGVLSLPGAVLGGLVGFGAGTYSCAKPLLY